MKNFLFFIAIIFFIPCSGIADNSSLWMRYPAISPDGQTIVFSFQGDLFTVSARGGEAKHLTVHQAYDFRPVWSPDGKQIAFASNRFGNFDVFLISATGGQATRLTDYSSNEYPDCFSPDGKAVDFSASIDDAKDNVQFPSGVLSELYSVPTIGGKVTQLLSTPAELAQIDKEGKHIYYQDRKGYENAWRKHHTSSVTRDIWMYDMESGKHTRLTSFDGEDRNPVLNADETRLYFLSERFGSFNVCQMPLDHPANVSQVTDHENHPVRFLTVAKNGSICYAYDGEIYLIPSGGEITKLTISIPIELKENQEKFQTLTNGATEMKVSPSGKEIAFILRGEVFVTAVDYPTTKQITHTPGQERSVSFSPDGKAILYASERDGSWNIYQTRIIRDEEHLFTLSTLLKEDTILAIPEETFQPAFSPDGKEVAYLEERETLKVINLETKETRTILDGKYNYSYSDGDQWYEWSPDGHWFLASYSPHSLFMNDVALIDASGGAEPVNLTKSGYYDGTPRWMMKGNAIIWFSDRQGLRSHGSWGSTEDVFAFFLNQKTFDRFNLSKEEYDQMKEADKKKKDKLKRQWEKDGHDPDTFKEPVEDVNIDLTNIEDRKKRLTINSSNLADALLTPDGEKLYYLSKFEDGFDLWVNKLRDKETKMVMNLKGNAGSLQMDKKGKFLFLFSDKKIIKIKIGEKPEKKVVAYKAEMNLDLAAERAYMFEHVWRQVKKKFYNPDLHQVDWDFYKAAYKKFLPYISNNFDFAEMLSEMLGELNASHTGSGYRFKDKNGDQTAKLAAFYDPQFPGPGIKITEIIEKSPLIQDGSKIKPGSIIEKIDGQLIDSTMNYYDLLNHKAGKFTLLSLFDQQSGERWDERVKPITIRQENELLYHRWVKKMRSLCDSLSWGRI